MPQCSAMWQDNVHKCIKEAGHDEESNDPHERLHHTYTALDNDFFWYRVKQYAPKKMRGDQMRFKAKMNLEASAQEQEGPSTTILPGAFGTGKKKVPLYSGPAGDPNRRIIGEVEIDLEIGEMQGVIDEH